MIHYRQGDLLTTNDEYIIHGVNCRGVMNAGLAKTIREKWPVVYCRYMEMIKRFNKDDVPDDERLSSFQIVEISDPRNRPTHVINFFSQTTYGHNGRFVSYDALDEGLAALAVELRKRKVKSISIPKIGSGLGGGNWKVIEQIIMTQYHRFQEQIQRMGYGNMTKTKEKYKCPCCDGKGTFYLEGNIYQNGGVVPCLICNNKGWLTEEEQAEVDEVRKEFNEIIQGDPPRSGIFSKRLKNDARRPAYLPDAPLFHLPVRAIRFTGRSAISPVRSVAKSRQDRNRPAMSVLFLWRVR